jgi:hypothetical protein
VAHTTDNTDILIRAELWSAQMKEELQDELQAQKYVRWLSEFPDGDTFTIPSIGQALTDDYVEDTPVKYRSLDTGEFQFSITEYVSSGHYITKKARQDLFYASQLEAGFVPKQKRAIMVRLEEDIMELQGQQTAADLNNINGAPHRWVAGGTNQIMTPQDFAKARYSLKKANVPDTNLVAIVDPSVEYTLNTMTNLVNMSNNPQWEGIVSSGIATGMRFVKNIYGFDVYTSNYIDDVSSETIDSVAAADAKANLFFSATAGDTLPFVGAWRQMPEVDAGFNKDFQREEYVTTARWGVKLYRPENFVVVLSEVHL